MRAAAAPAVVLALLLAGCGGAGSGPHAPATTATAVVRTPATPLPAHRGALPSLDAQAAAVRHYASAGLPVFCGARRGRLVALTFDDGPGPYTPIALRQLREAGARATFFLVADSIAREPDRPRQEREQDAAIGDHTMTHPNLTSLPFAAAMAEIRGGRAAALRAAGAPVDLFRPPFGAHDAAIDQAAGREGLAEILWDVDSEDSRTVPPADYREISRNVRRDIRPGSIVLMHENRGQTIRAMRAILPALKRRHLQLVTVPELLAADPPSQAQLDKGRKGCKAGTADPRR
jgi:peptidoglycan/xylan/chitin deacetylase (PgdA/CDA1 family)